MNDLCEMDVLDAETCFPELMRRVEGGEAIVIRRGGRPAAKLISAPSKRGSATVRPDGKIEMHPNVMHLDEQTDEFSFTVDKA